MKPEERVIAKLIRDNQELRKQLFLERIVRYGMGIVAAFLLVTVLHLMLSLA